MARKPRELTWVTGVILTVLTASVDVTGYFLPRDQIGYWAAKIVTDVPEAIPVIRSPLVELLRGSASTVGPAVSVTMQGPFGDFVKGQPWFKYATSAGITKVVLRVNQGSVNSVYFQDSAGNTSNVYGGQQGEEVTVNINWPNEYLTSLTGTYQVKTPCTIVSLTFTTNLNTYGPFGNGNVIPGVTAAFDHLPIAKDEALVGFHGKSDQILNAIGIFSAPRDAALLPSIKLPQFATVFGTPWSYQTNKGIKKIVITLGQYIKSLSFQDGTGANSGPFGGQGNGQQITVSFDYPSEYLKTMVVNMKSTTNDSQPILSRIRFITNKQSYGPFGEYADVDGHHIDWYDYKNVGIHGTATDNIHSISLIVQPLNK